MVRAQGAPVRGAEGSPLLVDSVVWPDLPVGDMVSVSIISAVDHLHLIQGHLLSRMAFPFASQTVLRTALLAGAQAVWMLSSTDSGELCRRGLLLAEETYRQHANFLKGGAQGTIQMPEAERLANLRRVESRLAAAREVRVDALGGRLKGTFAATAAVDQAAMFAFGPEGARGYTTLWRLASGDAHALGWQIPLRAGAAHAPN